MGNALATYQGRDGSGPPPETVTLLDLPLLVIKKILVYLSAEDVWQLGATCRQLRELCADDKLWRDRMVREARTLVLDELSDDQAVLLHQRHHITMTVRNPHLDEPRLHWSSTRPRKRREPPSRGALLDSWALITDLVTGRSAAGAVPTGLTPRILMYGSGLENKSPWERQSLLRRIMKGKAEEGLHVHSLAPRPNRDVDAGWRFRFSDDATFDLIPLFSTTYITCNTSEVRRPQTLGSAASQTRLYGGRLKMEYFVTKELQHADDRRTGWCMWWRRPRIKPTRVRVAGTGGHAGSDDGRGPTAAPPNTAAGRRAAGGAQRDTRLACTAAAGHTHRRTSCGADDVGVQSDGPVSRLQLASGRVSPRTLTLGAWLREAARAGRVRVRSLRSRRRC